MSAQVKCGAYAGKILKINLSNGEIYSESTLNYAKQWLGSSGIAIKVLYDELRPWVTAYDPANRLIFGAGVLQGTVAPGACKMTVSTLGPVTGGWATSAADTHVGTQLKHAGYDLLVVAGRARQPVFLWIDDDRVEIRDATHLWGLTTSEALEAIRNDLNDPGLHVLSIGPAGENLVRGACIIHDKDRAFGRCGTGAVMGAKNLKAVVVRGSKGLSVADPKRFMSIVTELRRRAQAGCGLPGMERYGTLGVIWAKQHQCGIAYKNFQEVKLPDEMAEVIDPTKAVDKYRIARKSFPGCLIGCGQVLYFHDGPFAGLTVTSNQWEAVGTLQGRLAVWEPQFMFKANALANDLGVDIDLVGGAIGWAMECYQRGIIDERDTGGLKLEWGNIELIFELMNMIAWRRGFGNVLAEGSAKAADIVGRGSQYYAMHIKGQDLYEPLRGAMGWALGTVVSTRGGGHTTGAPQLETSGGFDPEKMARVTGVGPDDLDPLEYKGKPKLVMFTEVLHRVANCLGICHYNTAWSNLDSMSLPEMAELYSSATGWEVTEDELKEAAMRQLNLEKAFNLRHTRFGRKDDMPPPRDLQEPIPTGRLAGFKIDKKQWEAMLDEYYALHGWDPENGFPTKETLTRLGLATVADDLARIGKLGDATELSHVS